MTSHLLSRLRRSIAGDAAVLADALPRPAACPRHRRDRLHRPPAGRGADQRRTRRHRADARSGQGGDAAAAAADRHEPRANSRRHPDRRRDQSRRRADRERPVDAPETTQDPVVAAAHDARRRPADRTIAATPGGVDQRLRHRLVRPVAGRNADRVRRRQALLHASRLRGLGARGEEGAAAGRPGGAAAHRPGARHRGRNAQPAPDSVRVRPRRPDRQRPAMDVLDRARRSRAADRAHHRDAVADRRGECDRADAGDECRVCASAGPCAAAAGAAQGAGSRPASSRRRVRRRTAARRPARRCPTRRR